MIELDELRRKAEAASVECAGEQWGLFGKLIIRAGRDRWVGRMVWWAKRCAEFIVAANPSTVLALLAEIDRCHARLEIDRVWHATTGGDVPKRVSYAERNTIPDGIECRDETIKMQDERIKALEAKVSAARNAALDEAERTVARCEDEFDAAAAIRDLKEETK